PAPRYQPSLTFQRHLFPQIDFWWMKLRDFLCDNVRPETCLRKALDCFCIERPATIQESKFSWFIPAARSGAIKTKAHGRFRRASSTISKIRSKLRSANSRKNWVHHHPPANTFR